ncbi:TonB-dependent receptor [Chitinophaga sp. MM2321]|uniref:SusC/RagA family TonB-linked outer membrane protein n=1 Tax=Chitinophaga sp. MM2321 TaxID=3137178 RepID=UPI0032D5B12A
MGKITLHRRLGIILILLLAIFQQPDAFGQSGHLFKGKVKDVDGTPLPGVNVVMKGTTKGATTNGSGDFQFSGTTATATLVFSFVGYDSKEVEASSQQEVNVFLQSSNKQMGEVVVIGYGTQKKINLTGAVSVIDGKTMNNRSVASASLALQGAAPGVTVTQQSGVPGGDGGTIRIRGIGSINAGQNPLVLIDNIEMSMDAIDPNNIASISVLKDAAAAAIYGSRAANGVILITTKRGTNGVNVSYNGYLTKQTPTDLPVKVSALDHMKLWDVAQVNSGLPPAFTQQIADYEKLGPDNFSRFNTNWKDLVLVNNGLMHNHNINVSAGNDKIKVFGSGSYLGQNGLTANTDFNRIDLRFNTDIALTSKLGASVDVVVNRSERNWPGNSNPQSIIRYMLGLPATAPGQYDTGEWGEGWSNTNPAAQAKDGGFDKLISDTRILTGTLTYKPIKGMEILASYSSNFLVDRGRKLQGQYQIYTADVANNKLDFARPWPNFNAIYDNNAQTKRNVFRTQASYNWNMGDHAFTVLGGFSTELFNTSFVNTYRQNLISESLPYLDAADPLGQTLSGSESEYAMASAYSRINYNYKEKYLLEVNGRFDASSRFRKENWWKLFPSVSAGWRISEENFWKPISNIITNAKIRASYGSLGNQNLSSYYPTYALYSSGSAYNYYFNNAINAGYAVSTAANPFIKWETSKILDIGADFYTLNNRLSVTADYFKREITDMLQLDGVPTYVGLGAPFINIGSMRNTGWELGLGWKDRVNEFSYNVQFNISDVRNEVTNLGGKEYISGALITKEGYALNSYYGYEAMGLFQSQEEIDKAPFHFANTKPGDIQYRDISGAAGTPDGKIDAYDRVVLDNSFPRYEYSLSLGGQYKGFDVNVFLQGVGKRNNYMSGTGAQPFYSASFQGTIFEHQRDAWSPENTDAAYPRLTANSITNNYVASSFWMKSGAYARLKNVVLGYTLPKSLTSKAKIKSVRLYVSGQNLFTWDKFFPGFDVEQTNTAGEFYPIMKTYTVGLNVNF